MKSRTGTYKIQKGQKIVANCHLAQRDKDVFTVPGCKGVDEFDPSRFNLKVSGTSLGFCYLFLLLLLLFLLPLLLLLFLLHR